MDYGGGSFLTQAQWKKIQNPGVIINWFDDAEDAQFSQVAACISSAALDMTINFVFKWVEVNFLDQNPNNNYSLTDFKNIWASSDKWEVFSSAGIACGASLIPLPTDKAKLVGVAMASFGAGGVALIADAGNQYDKLPANLGFTAKIQRVNWEQSFKKAGIQAFIAGVATGVSLYAIDHPRFRNFAATLRGIGYAKVKQIMTQSGFSDDASDAFCRRFGLQIIGSLDDLLKNPIFKGIYEPLENGSLIRKYAQYRVSTAEEASLKLFVQDNYYANFNKALAGEIPMTVEYGAMKSLIISAHSKLPKYIGTVYRGAGKTESAFAKTLSPNQTFNFNGRVTSSSIDDFIADDFRRGGLGDVIWEIQSKTGADIKLINSAESEILFKPFTGYKLINVVSSTKTPNVLIYKIIEL